MSEESLSKYAPENASTDEWLRGMSGMVQDWADSLKRGLDGIQIGGLITHMEMISKELLKVAEKRSSTSA